MAFPNSYPKTVYVNGKILPAQDAKISIFDRGFLFGDGVYEVMTWMQGRFFKEAYHIKRLKRSLSELQIDFDPQGLKPEILKVLASSELLNQDCLLYIQITRGTAPRQHAFPASVKPTVVIYAWAKSLPEINTALARVRTQQDFRWFRCDIKATSLLGNVLANQAAAEHECYETLFVREGKFTEASHCNVFFVRNATVYTYPAGPNILNGITRQVVLELCEKLTIPFQETGVDFDQLGGVDEAFLTGTSTQIMAISHIDNISIGNGLPGKITQQLQAALRLEKQQQK
jgi:D-alanine transaminase